MSKSPTPDYCVLILTHGRPNRVLTVNTLAKHGYTGPWYLVIDDEDPTQEEYKRLFGDRVRVFSKDEIAAHFDEGDNSSDRRCIVYARNASFGVAAELGYQYFVQLDDDYTDFRYRFDGEYRPLQGNKAANIQNLSAVLDAMVSWYASLPPAVASVAMAQSGDYIGGIENGLLASVRTKRKAMNSFICDSTRPFLFPGKLNEDVIAYTALQRRGLVFLTVLQVYLAQMTTQASSGGMTEIYEAQGTYAKSFYAVLHCPSAVKVRTMRSTQSRIHHEVKWNHCAPKILRPRAERTIRT